MVEQPTVELVQLMGAPLFKTNGWAQSSPFPVRPFVHHLFTEGGSQIFFFNYLPHSVPSSI